jgi:protein-disulfide isomerase
MSKTDDRRNQASAAREAAQSAAKKERLIRNIGASVVVVLVAAIIGVGVFASRSGDPAGPEAKGTIPVGVNADDGSWTYNPDAATDATLELFKDFQCPGCGFFEATYGDAVAQLAEEGIVKVVLRPAVFLDDRIPGLNSSRALNALGCAIDQGVGIEYKKAVYAAQPATEGSGWTDAQLINLGTDVGLAADDATTFSKCVTEQEHLIWATVADESFSASGVSSTPTVRLNGVEVPAEVLSSNNPATFIDWVKANA